MWVAVSDWMLADDDPPLPSVGSMLRSVGVRLMGTVAAAEAGAADAVAEVASTNDPVPWLVEYVVTGTAGQARDVDVDGDRHRQHSGAEFVLTADEHRFQVRFDGWAHDVAPDSRVAVRGRLSVVGGYEWEAFGLTESRADWRVGEVVVLDTGGAMIDLDRGCER
jgi:hypothetical protein